VIRLLPSKNLKMSRFSLSGSRDSDHYSKPEGWLEETTADPFLEYKFCEVNVTVRVWHGLCDHAKPAFLFLVIFTIYE
jgi:hypothetical protein